MLVLLAILASVAQASPKPIRLDPAQVRTVSVPVEVSSGSIQRETPPESKLELAFSSWKPNDISLEARDPLAKTFHATSAPSFSASYISQALWAPSISSSLASSFHLKGGLGFSDMKRTGSVILVQTEQSDTQHLYIIPLRLGAEAALHPLTGFFSRIHFAPTIGFSVVPSLLIANESVIAAGFTDSSLYYEASVGAGFTVVSGFELSLRGVRSFGRVESTEFTNYGLEAGLRITI